MFLDNPQWAHRYSTLLGVYLAHYEKISASLWCSKSKAGMRREQAVYEALGLEHIRLHLRGPLACPLPECLLQCPCTS